MHVHTQCTARLGMQVHLLRRYIRYILLSITRTLSLCAVTATCGLAIYNNKMIRNNLVPLFCYSSCPSVAVQPLQPRASYNNVQTWQPLYDRPYIFTSVCVYIEGPIKLMHADSLKQWRNNLRPPVDGRRTGIGDTHIKNITYMNYNIFITCAVVRIY
jgi:hypothetical protein